MLKRLILAFLITGVALFAAAYAYASRHGEIAAIAPPGADSFDPGLVAQGEMLAAVGNCASCHTAEGGADYAGGYSTATPFGIVYSTNITPDPVEGIGAWSSEAFARALRQGVDRTGNHLYPVFPYDHFTLLTDADVAALYAYFMTRTPAGGTLPANELGFPFDQRILLAGWKLLHLEDRRFEPDPDQSEAWNRGAYLVEALGHCGACHTPRNRLGALDGADAFGGAVLGGGWYAPALNAAAPDPLPWTRDALVNYLLDGWDRDHGVAAGPMVKVVENIGAHLNEDDVYAMADYLMTHLPQAPDDLDRSALRDGIRARDLSGQVPTDEELARTADDPVLRQGQEIFARACANCHRQGTQNVPLGMTTSLNAADPRNVISVTRYGIRPPSAVPDKSMPGFAALTGDEMTALARYMRWAFTDKPAWQNLDAAVTEVFGG